MTTLEQQQWAQNGIKPAYPRALASIFPRVRALTMKSVRAIWQRVSVWVCV